MKIYTLLAKKQKRRTGLSRSEEMRFYLANREVLAGIPKFSKFYTLTNYEFDLIRANIVIQALLNKKAFEAEADNWRIYVKDDFFDKKAYYEAISSKIVECPYFLENDIKIFIPVFARAINLLYQQEPEKLIDEPYLSMRKNFHGAIVDPFDTYGADLYNSYFTRLVKISSNGRESAYFHYDTNKIYIINSQGRLDETITLFDKFMKKVSYSHMLERLTPVADAYLNNDKHAFIENLYNSHFISSKMLYLIRRRKATN